MENGKKFLDGDKVGGVDRQNQGKKNLVGRTRRGQRAWYKMSKQVTRHTWSLKEGRELTERGTLTCFLYTVLGDIYTLHILSCYCLRSLELLFTRFKHPR